MLDTVMRRCYIVCSKKGNHMLLAVASVTVLVVAHMLAGRTRYKF